MSARLRSAVLLAVLAGAASAAQGDTYPRQPGVDVLHYSFRLTLSDQTDAIEGEATLTARLAAGVAEVSLDLAQPKAGAPDEETEQFEATRMMVAKRPVKADSTTNATVLINGPLMVEVLFPTIAKSPKSTAQIFVQTLAGRKKSGLRAGGQRLPKRTPRSKMAREPPGETPPRVRPSFPRGGRTDGPP